jgi:enterochelin esterase-like enzyme
MEEALKFKNMPVWLTWGETEWLAGPNRQLKDFLVEIGADVKWKEVEGVGHSYLGEYQEDLMDWFNTKSK